MPHTIRSWSWNALLLFVVVHSLVFNRCWRVHNIDLMQLLKVYALKFSKTHHCPSLKDMEMPIENEPRFSSKNTISHPRWIRSVCQCWYVILWQEISKYNWLKGSTEFREGQRVCKPVWQSRVHQKRTTLVFGRTLNTLEAGSGAEGGEERNQQTVQWRGRAPIHDNKDNTAKATLIFSPTLWHACAFLHTGIFVPRTRKRNGQNSRSHGHLAHFSFLVKLQFGCSKFS